MASHAEEQVVGEADTDGDRVHTSFDELKSRVQAIPGTGEESLALCALICVCCGISPAVRKHWQAACNSTQALFEGLLATPQVDHLGVEGCRTFLALCASRLYALPVRIQFPGGSITVGTAETKFLPGSSAFTVPPSQFVEGEDTRHPWQQRGSLPLDPFAQVDDRPFRDLLTRDAERIVKGLGKVRNPVTIRSIVRALRALAFGADHLTDESLARVIRRARRRKLESEVFSPTPGATILPYEPSDYEALGRELEHRGMTVWIAPVSNPKPTAR